MQRYALDAMGLCCDCVGNRERYMGVRGEHGNKVPGPTTYGCMNIDGGIGVEIGYSDLRQSYNTKPEMANTRIWSVGTSCIYSVTPAV